MFSHPLSQDAHVRAYMQYYRDSYISYHILYTIHDITITLRTLHIMVTYQNARVRVAVPAVLLELFDTRHIVLGNPHLSERQHPPISYNIIYTQIHYYLCIDTYIFIHGYVVDGYIHIYIDVVLSNPHLGDLGTYYYYYYYFSATAGSAYRV